MITGGDGGDGGRGGTGANVTLFSGGASVSTQQNGVPGLYLLSRAGAGGLGGLGWVNGGDGGHGGNNGIDPDEPENAVPFEDDRLISQIRSASDRPFFADDPRPRFLTDVAVVDAMFQTGGMLEVMTTNIIVLPYTIGRMQFHQPLVPGATYLCITQRIAQGRETNTYRLQLVDDDGQRYITIEDFEMVQVDRLAEDDQIVDRLNVGARRQRAS